MPGYILSRSSAVHFFGTNPSARRRYRSSKAVPFVVKCPSWCKLSRHTVASAAAEGQAADVEALQRALDQAKAAVQVAEDGLDRIDRLPSATGPSLLSRLWPVMAPWLLPLLALGGMALGSYMGLMWQRLTGLVGATALGLSGMRKGSLSASGAFAAAVVGTLTIGSSFRAGVVLLAFYFSSSKLTKYKEELKDVDVEHKKGGQRDWKQVFCNALLPALLALWYGIITGGQDTLVGSGAVPLTTLLAGAFLGYYACCCGDTWASEVGQLSEDTPWLITSFRPVRKGTNGGVTRLGLGASVAGGLLMGIVFFVCTVWTPAQPTVVQLSGHQWLLVPLGLLAGLLGSIIDSLLGATIQYSGFDRVQQRVTGRPGPNVTAISGYPLLDNNAVNLVSATLTSAVTAGLAFLIWR